MEAGVSVFDEN